MIHVLLIGLAAYTWKLSKDTARLTCKVEGHAEAIALNMMPNPPEWECKRCGEPL